MVGGMMSETMGTITGSSATSQQQDSAGFCENCGAKLYTDTKFCEECGTMVIKSNSSCINCGYKFERNSKFCPKCGAKR